MTDPCFHQPHPGEHAVFLEAVEFKTLVERSEFLDQKCGSDAQLRARVKALLAIHDGHYLIGRRLKNQTNNSSFVILNETQMKKFEELHHQNFSNGKRGQRGNRRGRGW